MIDILALENTLSVYGIIEYCNYNNIENSTFIVALNAVTESKDILDSIIKPFVNIEFINNVPSTMENGIYKIMFDNFPNV